MGRVSYETPFVLRGHFSHISFSRILIHLPSSSSSISLPLTLSLPLPSMATGSSSSTAAGSSSPTAAGSSSPTAAGSSSPTAAGSSSPTAAGSSSPTAAELGIIPAAGSSSPTAAELGIIPRTESNRGQGDFLAALLICLFESIEGLESFLNTIRHDTHHLNEFCLLCCLKTISCEPPSEAIKFQFFFRICEDFDREFSTMKNLLEFVMRDIHFWSEGGTWKDFMSSPLFDMFGFSSRLQVKTKFCECKGCDCDIKCPQYYYAAEGKDIQGIIYQKAEIQLIGCLCELESGKTEFYTEMSTTLTDLSDCFIACDFSTYPKWLDLDHITLDYKDKYLVKAIIVMVDSSPAIYLRCQQDYKRILHKEGILQITTVSMSDLCDKPAIIVFYRRILFPLPPEKYNTHPPEKYEETKAGASSAILTPDDNSAKKRKRDT